MKKIDIKKIATDIIEDIKDIKILSRFAKAAEELDIEVDVDIPKPKQVFSALKSNNTPALPKVNIKIVDAEGDGVEAVIAKTSKFRFLSKKTEENTDKDGE